MIVGARVEDAVKLKLNVVGRYKAEQLFADTAADPARPVRAERQ